MTVAEDTLMIAPEPERRMTGATALHIIQTPVTLPRMTRSHSASAMASKLMRSSPA